MEEDAFGSVAEVIPATTLEDAEVSDPMGLTGNRSADFCRVWPGVELAEEEGKEDTYDGRGPALLDMDAGVCSRPIADTLLSLFFSAANAELCGRSMSRPYRHL